LVSCGISYALSVCGDFYKDIFRPGPAGQKRPDERKIGDYKRQKIEEQTEGLEVNSSGADPMDETRDGREKEGGQGFLSGKDQPHKPNRNIASLTPEMFRDVFYWPNV
jgi:hypothetical protein